MATYSGSTLLYDHSIKGSLVQPVTRDPLLDQTFDGGTLSYAYRVRPDWSAEGDASFYTDVNYFHFQYADDIVGTYISSPFKVASILEYNARITGRYSRVAGSPVGSVTLPRVKWSKIGSFDFEIDKTNVAGNMPLDHDGLIAQVAKLGKQVIVYSSGGVTALSPAPYGGYGKQIISDIGIKHPWSWAGTERIHFYINANNELCKFTTQGLEYLGYQHLLLDTLTYWTLVINKYDELLFICDGTTGYVYSIQDNCMSEGPATITGHIVTPDGPYYGSSSAIAPPDFNLVTDIIDFSTRKFKTITAVEVGFGTTDAWAFDPTDTSLRVRIHYKTSMYSSNNPFSTTPWTTIGPDGIANCTAFGREFKIELFCDSTISEFDLDMLRIHGFIHDYNPKDLI